MSDLTTPGTPAPQHHARRSSLPLSEARVSGMIDEWVAHWIITAEQGTRMRESEDHEVPGAGLPSSSSTRSTSCRSSSC